MKINMPILRPVPFPKGISMWESLFTYTRLWEVYENYELNIPLHPTIVIPKGFIFDGASIPKLFRNLVSPTGPLLIPGLVHDFGYRYNFLNCIKNGKVDYYMKGAGKCAFDLLLFEIANHIDGFVFVNKLVYLSVKYFGQSSWKMHKRTQIK